VVTVPPATLREQVEVGKLGSGGGLRGRHGKAAGLPTIGVTGGPDLGWEWWTRGDDIAGMVGWGGGGNRSYDE